MLEYAKFRISNLELKKNYFFFGKGNFKTDHLECCSNDLKFSVNKEKINYFYNLFTELLLYNKDEQNLGHPKPLRPAHFVL